MLKTLGLSLDAIKEILGSEQQNEILLLLLEQQEKRICQEVEQREKTADFHSVSKGNAEKRRRNSGAISLRHRADYGKQKRASYNTWHYADSRHFDGSHSAGAFGTLALSGNLGSLCGGNAVCDCHGRLDDTLLLSARFLRLPALSCSLSS